MLAPLFSSNVTTIEPSEEIRLCMIQVLQVLTKSTSDPNPYLQDTVSMIRQSLSDPFPAVRKACCECITSLAHHPQMQESNFRMYASVLLAAIVTCLEHAHSKLRIHALQATTPLLLCTEQDDLKPWLERLRGMVMDKNPTVCETLVHVMGTLLSQHKEIYGVEHLILPTILVGASSESPELQTASYMQLTTLGESYLKDHMDEHKAYLESGLEQTWPLPFPYECRPPLGIREYVKSQLFKCVPLLVNDMNSWTAIQRRRASCFLHAMAICCEDSLVRYTPELFPIMLSNINNDDHLVRRNILESCQYLGCFLPANLLSAFILPYLTGDKVASDVYVRVQALSMWQAFLQAPTIHAEIVAIYVKTTFLPHMPHLFKGLSEAAHHVPMEGDAYVDLLVSNCQHLLSVCHTFSNNLTFQSESSYHLVVFVLKIQSLRHDLYDAMLTVLDDISTLFGYASRVQLFDAHFESLLELTTTNIAAWHHSSPQFTMFCALFRLAISNNCSHIERLLSALVKLITVAIHNDEGDVLVKVAALLHDAAHPEFLVSDLLVPLTTWRIGHAASKAKCMTLQMIHQCLLESQNVSLEWIPSFLPNLIASLDDDCSETRLHAIHILRIILPNLALDTLDITCVVKRLNDPSNDVRIQSACCLCVWEAHISSLDAVLPTILENVVLHMDDDCVDLRRQVSIFVDACHHRLPTAVAPLLQATIPQFRHHAEFPQWQNASK